MATSDRPWAGRAMGYLTSRKHLTGTAGGLVGVGLSLAGMGGPLWPAVVAGLYAAGALAAPAEPSTTDRVRVALVDAAEEAARLRRDLAHVAERILDAVDDLPPGATDHFREVERKLAGMLGHPHTLVEADVLHVLAITVDKDLCGIVGNHLALPTHQRRRPLPGRDLTPDQALVHHLRLLDEYVTVTSDQLFRSELQEIVNLGDYLEARNRHNRDG